MAALAERGDAQMTSPKPMTKVAPRGSDPVGGGGLRFAQLTKVLHPAKLTQPVISRSMGFDSGVFGYSGSSSSPERSRFGVAMSPSS